MKQIRGTLFNILIAALSLILVAFPAQASGDKQQKIMTGPNQEKIAVTAERQSVYGLSLFDGGQYQTTFCPKPMDTVYMVSNVDNVVTYRRTETYYWPLTKEYMANWMELNQNQAGSLEIMKGSRPFKTLSRVKFVFLMTRDGSKATAIRTGAAAVAAYRNFSAKVTAYYDQMDAYTMQDQAYQQLIKEYIKDPKQFGGKAPLVPREPQPPTHIISPIDHGFILNLAPGNYRIRFKDRIGKVIPASEKKLVVFPVLAKGVSYDIIPEEKWTSPVKSAGSDHLFLRNGQVLYLKPFAARQYNSHHLIKLSQLTKQGSGRGEEDRRQWAAVRPVTGKTMMLLKNGKPVQTITETPYIVKQRPGYSLGYDIKEYTPERFPGEKPSFTAYRIKLPSKPGQYQLQLEDAKGVLIQGSRRNVYNIPKLNWGILLITLLPLGVGVVLKIYRRRLLKANK